MKKDIKVTRTCASELVVREDVESEEKAKAEVEAAKKKCKTDKKSVKELLKPQIDAT